MHTKIIPQQQNQNIYRFPNIYTRTVSFFNFWSFLFAFIDSVGAFTSNSQNPLSLSLWNS